MNPRTRLRINGFATAVALLMTVMAAARPAAAPSLSHLRGIEEVKSWFNATKGHPRLILLLSPT